MTTRRAACSCGQLTLTIAGEPSRISMCHCLECQRRTGAVLSNQARFRREQIAFAGKSTAWTRTAESGNALTFHFCPTCGSTVYWEGAGFPGLVAVAIGTLADPTFPAAHHLRLGGVPPPLGARRPIPQRGAWPSRGERGHALTCHPGIRRRRISGTQRHRCTLDICSPGYRLSERPLSALGRHDNIGARTHLLAWACRGFECHPVQAPR